MRTSVRRAVTASAAAGVALAATARAAVRPAAGTLLAAQPMAGAPAGARAWRVRYTSTDDRGRAEAVTGVVIAPAGAASAGSRPVLAWAHGTSGVTERCAPSLSPRFFAATPGLPDALARGYVVVATDYAGLGTPQPHPYLVGASAAHGVLDAVRAARAIGEAGAGRRFAVWGESQGGHAALFTGELARSYAPELSLVGVAAAAPPTDLTANLGAGGDPSARAFITAFAAHSWARHFGYPLGTLGRPATGRLIERLARNCVVLDAKPKLLTVIGVLALRRDLRGVDLGTVEPWARTARANSAGGRPPGAPLFLAQNANDVIVAPAVTRAFARRACQGGARVRWLDITGPGHPTSGRDSAKPTLDWIAARFRGDPAPSDCAAL